MKIDLLEENRRNTRIYGVGMALYAVERSKDVPFIKWENTLVSVRDAYLFKARLLTQTLEKIGLVIVERGDPDA